MCNTSDLISVLLFKLTMHSDSSVFLLLQETENSLTKKATLTKPVPPSPGRVKLLLLPLHFCTFCTRLKLHLQKTGAHLAPSRDAK